MLFIPIRLIFFYRYVFYFTVIRVVENHHVHAYFIIACPPSAPPPLSPHSAYKSRAYSGDHACNIQDYIMIYTHTIILIVYIYKRTGRCNSISQSIAIKRRAHIASSSKLAQAARITLHIIYTNQAARRSARQSTLYYRLAPGLSTLISSLTTTIHNLRCPARSSTFQFTHTSLARGHLKLRRCARAAVFSI